MPINNINQWEHPCQQRETLHFCGHIIMSNVFHDIDRRQWWGPPRPYVDGCANIRVIPEMVTMVCFRCQQGRDNAETLPHRSTSLRFDLNTPIVPPEVREQRARNFRDRVNAHETFEDTEVEDVIQELQEELWQEMQDDLQPEQDHRQVATVEIREVEIPAEEYCPICREGYTKDGHVAISLVCNHEFALTCIQTWLSHNTTCPVCRHQLYAEVAGG